MSKKYIILALHKQNVVKYLFGGTCDVLACQLTDLDLWE